MKFSIVQLNFYFDILDPLVNQIVYFIFKELNILAIEKSSLLRIIFATPGIE